MSCQLPGFDARLDAMFLRVLALVYARIASALGKSGCGNERHSQQKKSEISLHASSLVNDGML